MVVGFFVDVLVYLVVVVVSWRYVVRFVKRRTRTPRARARTRDAEVLSQGWIETGTKSDVAPAEDELSRQEETTLVATGRFLNAVRRHRTFRCEELEKGDERFTRVIRVDSRGRPTGTSSTERGALEEVVSRMF